MTDATYEGALNWDSDIKNDSPDFILLPEDDYDFEVTGYERGHFSGSDKLTPCAKAIVNIKIESPKGITVIKHNLYLHTKTEGLLCEFFTSIGLRKKGEKLKMNWYAVAGCTGRAKVGVRLWTTDKSEDRKSNEIKKFYPKEAKNYTAGEF